MIDKRVYFNAARSVRSFWKRLCSKSTKVRTPSRKQQARWTKSTAKHSEYESDWLVIIRCRHWKHLLEPFQMEISYRLVMLPSRIPPSSLLDVPRAGATHRCLKPRTHWMCWRLACRRSAQAQTFPAALLGEGGVKRHASRVEATDAKSTQWAGATFTGETNLEPPRVAQVRDRLQRKCFRKYGSKVETM